MIVLDKEEFRIKLEEINRLVEIKDYKGAMEVVDSIDWRRVKNVRTLCVVGEIYAANKKYEDSKEIFRLAYHRSPIGKNILYRLVEICLKTGDIEDAEDYYDEFCVVAPHDSNSYILKYKILKEQNAPVEEQIRVLEDYKESEFTEKWSYELASLYYKAGQKDKCQDLCNEMILWFSEGNYIIKALDLKAQMGTLTEKEKKKYEDQLMPVLSKQSTEEEKAASSDEDADSETSSEAEKEETEEDSSEDYDEDRDNPHIDSIIMKNEKDLQNAETLQERISKGIRDLFGGIRKEIGPAEENDEEYLEEEEDTLSGEDPSSEDFDDVPALEEEGEAVKIYRKKKRNHGRSFHIPELKTPAKESILDKKSAFEPDEDNLVIEDIVIPEEAPKGFNLEDTMEVPEIKGEDHD